MRTKRESFDWTWKRIGELRTQKMGEKEEKSISLVKGYRMSFGFINFSLAQKYFVL